MAKTGIYKVKPETEIENLIERFDANRKTGASSWTAIEDLKVREIFNEDGIPKTYWHIHATEPPEPPAGRRGNYRMSYDKAIRYGGPSMWEWQDWGPKHGQPR
jgi:hypothetical protein